MTTGYKRNQQQYSSLLRLVQFHCYYTLRHKLSSPLRPSIPFHLPFHTPLRIAEATVVLSRDRQGQRERERKIKITEKAARVYASHQPIQNIKHPIIHPSVRIMYDHSSTVSPSIHQSVVSPPTKYSTWLMTRLPW